MKRPSQAQAIRAQFKLTYNLTFALYLACNTDCKCLPYSTFVELLYPLAEQLYELDVICGHTHWSKITHRMRRYSSVLVELLRGNQTSVHPHILRALLGPLLTELKMVKRVYTKIESSRKAAQAANSKPEDANQKLEGAELAKQQPTQALRIRDGLVIITPPENMNDLMASSLTGKPDDIWKEYQACLPTDLAPEEVKIAYDSFMVMLEEHFI